jgi:hypothetical protein
VTVEAFALTKSPILILYSLKIFTSSTVRGGSFVARAQIQYPLVEKKIALVGDLGRIMIIRKCRRWGSEKNVLDERDAVLQSDQHGR